MLGCCFYVVRSCVKDDFIGNSLILSCFVQLKSVLFNLLCVLDLFFFRTPAVNSVSGVSFFYLSRDAILFCLRFDESGKTGYSFLVWELEMSHWAFLKSGGAFQERWATRWWRWRAGRLAYSPCPLKRSQMVLGLILLSLELILLSRTDPSISSTDPSLFRTDPRTYPSLSGTDPSLQNWSFSL